MVNILSFDRDSRVFRVDTGSGVQSLPWRSLYQGAMNDYIFDVNEYKDCTLYDVTLEERVLDDSTYRVAISCIQKGITESEEDTSVSKSLYYENRCGVLCKMSDLSILFVEYSFGGRSGVLIVYFEDSDVDITTVFEGKSIALSDCYYTDWLI